MCYPDRRHAGIQLASLLVGDTRAPLPRIVLALPRGGIPVAAPVASALSAPLAPLIVRKIGAPGRPELAVGAVAATGRYSVQTLRSDDLLNRLDVDEKAFAEARARALTELRSRVATFARYPVPSLAGLTVLVVDDGLATGATMRVAVRAVRAAGAALVLAVAPVGSGQAMRTLRPEVDAVVCPWVPRHFVAVGQAYEDFHQLSDAEALAALAISGP